jgi:hypothetical protein
MQASVTSRGPSSTNPHLVTLPAKNKDGSLLLQVDKGLIVSVNSVATLIWKHLEQNPRGLTLVEIVRYVEQSCSQSNSHVSREQIERDIGELLGYLEKRHVVKKRSRGDSGAVYRTMEGVLRTQNNASMYPAIQQFAGEADVAHQIKRLLTPISKDPSLATTVLDQIAEINRHHSKTQTLVALLTFAVYDILMKLLGFHRICRIIERRAFKKQKTDLLRILQVCAGVERARIWYPKEIKCMQHSVVIKFLLAHSGLNARLAIAGRCMPFQSHAWVELDGTVINDTQRVQQYYRVFAYF